MTLTLQQRLHLQRALREKRLDTLDSRNRPTTIRALFRRGLLRSEPESNGMLLGLMARFYVITPKGERALPASEKRAA